MSGPDARMAILRQRFHVRAAADRAAIATALEAGDRGRLLHLAHGLAGIAAIFGHADVGARAAALEEAVDQGLGDACLADPCQALIAALDEVAGTF